MNYFIKRYHYFCNWMQVSFAKWIFS